MRYCTQDDLRLEIPARTLIQLTCDVSPATEPDVSVVERAINSAEELIDGYLRSRYGLPLKSVPTVLRDLAVTIARHSLYARRPDAKDGLPEAIVRTYRDAIKMLESIQKGALTIGVQIDAKPQPEAGAMRIKAKRRSFDDCLMDRYK